MKYFYLGAAIVGAIVPYVFFIQFFGGAGLSLPALVSAVFSNPAASGFTADLVISSLVFWVFIFHRNRLADGPSPYPFVALNLLVGLSCALPAYLYAREVRRQTRSSSVG